MKKLLLIVTCALLMLSFAGCTVNLGNGIHINGGGIYKSDGSGNGGLPTISGAGNKSNTTTPGTSNGNNVQTSTGGNNNNNNNNNQNSSNGGNNTQTPDTGNNNQTSNGGNNTQTPESGNNNQPSGDVSSDIKPLSYGGLSESAFVTWSESSVSSAKAYYKLSNEANYTEVDKELIRETASGKARVDILGLKAGTYDLRVHVGGQNKDIEVKGVKVTAYDRSGYAHAGYTEGVGAYKDDGTLKSNAVVVYVTDSNKNSVSANGKTGLGNILASATGSKPVVVRLIGRIATKTKNSSGSWTGSETQLSGLTDKSGNGDNSYYNMFNLSSIKYLTLEGVGEDAEIYQWGMTFKNSNSVEVRNLTFTNYPEDACAFEGSSGSESKYKNYWIHNNCFNAGKNAFDETKEQDKGKGDGATDIKRVNSATFSYNIYNACHKTGLIGGSDDDVQWNITAHHNYYNSVYSRVPLGRNANMHYYNNYYYKVGGTCMSIRGTGFMFSECNYFASCSKTVELKNSGKVKSYNDVGIKGATTVSSRTASVSNSCKYDTTFNYTQSYVTDANTAKTDCEKYAGPCKANPVK